MTEQKVPTEVLSGIKEGVALSHTTTVEKTANLNPAGEVIKEIPNAGSLKHAETRDGSAPAVPKGEEFALKKTPLPDVLGDIVSGKASLEHAETDDRSNPNIPAGTTIKTGTTPRDLAQQVAEQASKKS